MENNYRGGVPQLVTTNEDDYAAYDKLPLVIRMALTETVFCVAAQSVYEFWLSTALQSGSSALATRWTLEKLNETEIEDLREFAKETGCWSHLNARATLLRYNSGRKPRNVRDPTH